MTPSENPAYPGAGDDGNDDTGGGGIPLPDALLAAAEAAVNALLALDPEGAARLAPVQGRVLRVEVVGFGFRIDIVPGDGGLRLFGDYAATPDCTVRGTPAALLGMTVSAHQEDEIFHGAVTIEGDSRVAQTIGEVLRGLDIDWEEQLARVTGDGLAHRLGQQARAGARWAGQSGENFTADVRDYLIEEGRLLPGPAEVGAFLDGVDTLRDDLERFEARVNRFAGRLIGDRVRDRVGDRSGDPIDTDPRPAQRVDPPPGADPQPGAGPDRP